VGPGFGTIDAGKPVDERILAKLAVDLASSPTEALLDLEDALDQLRARGVRAGERAARLVLKAV
jgi:hypothetical protein